MTDVMRVKSADPSLYLSDSEIIDWKHPAVLAQARQLGRPETTGLLPDKQAIAQRCFEFVRDEIKHSVDYRMNPVTCKASDVLEHKTGYCYAKSHLLAALLRANGIPAGLCYQRLTIADEEGDDGPFCLHGLNAVWLEEYGWYRIDARGNRHGWDGKMTINAQFCPPHEVLAFPVRVSGEADLPEIWSEPLSVVTQTLISGKTWDEVLQQLPDTELLVW